MFAFQSETENVAVATAPLPAPVVKPKLQPLAGLAEAVTPVVPAQPVQQAILPPQAYTPVQAPQTNVRATVFPAEGRPHSPWAGGNARIAAKLPADRGAEIGMPTGIPDVEDGIEGVRKLLFGRQMGEVQTKVAELQLSLNGEIKRLRESLMGRVDEMAGFLHRDMVVLREEMHAEIAQMKADLFTAATGLSSVKDRLLTVETKSREETSSAITEIEGRLVRQEHAFATALDNIERKLGATIDSKCVEAFAHLAKKSDVAALLDKISTRVEEEKPAAESIWVSSAPKAPALPQVGDTWAALAAGVEIDAKARDWHPATNPFMAEDHLGR